MATLYLDFENGNDNYAGTSFAPLAQGTDGRLSAFRFSSATSSFPNDGSLIGQYITLFDSSSYRTFRIASWFSSTALTLEAIPGGNSFVDQTVDRQFYIGGRWKSLTTGATATRTLPGDTIRMMGSPAPTSLGQTAVWTSQALQATRGAVSSTNTSPIVFTSNSHGYSTGDTVVITGHTVNTNANGTWEITKIDNNTFTLDGSVGNGVGAGTGTVRLRNNTRVKLTSAVTQNIASTGPRTAAWTASANVTTSITAGSGKEHVNPDRIDIAAAFTTGLAAYWPTGTINLSGYQQVSFWIRQNSGTIGAAGAVDLRLCSDTAGVTAVNTISIPNLAVISRWMPVTVDLGTNLGSSIQSIAFYVNTDNGAQQFDFNNIIACKASSAADSLTLTSLIGKNTTGETFWGIQSINGTRVMLDADTTALPTTTTLRGYYGTSETVTTWKRETIKLGPAATASTALQTIQEAGTDGSPITYSGGWDRTNMSTQNLETWLDGVNGNGYGMNNTLNWVSIANLATVRFSIGVLYSGTTGTGANLSSLTANNNSAGFQSEHTGTYQYNFICANSSGPVSASTNGRAILQLGKVFSNGAIASLPTGPNTIITGEFYNSSGYGIAIGTNYGGFKLLNCKFGANSSGSINFTGVYGNVYLKNCLFEDTTEINIGNTGSDLLAYSHDHDQTTNNHKIFYATGIVSAATDQRHTASGISWKIQPTASTVWHSARPLPFSLAKVACAANSLVTIKAWMRRDNTGLTMRLVCKGGQIAGVTSDVVSAMTAAANTWEELTITFTPTEVGVVEITAEAWGGTTYSGWVDDMTISQA